MGSIIRPSGTVFYSLLYLNSWLGFNRLKHMYSVISVKIDSLTANNKNRETTRSWTAKVRFVNPWAALILSICVLMYVCVYVCVCVCVMLWCWENPTGFRKTQYTTPLFVDVEEGVLRVEEGILNHTWYACFTPDSIRFSSKKSPICSARKCIRFPTNTHLFSALLCMSLSANQPIIPGLICQMSTDSDKKIIDASISKCIQIRANTHSYTHE